MSKQEYLENAIDTLRKMERSDTPQELCNEFDRFIREQIFGKYNLDLTVEECDALKDYYIATL